MKTRSLNLRISVLLLACGATLILTSAPEAGAVIRTMIKPHGIVKPTSMGRYKPWSRLWSAPIHAGQTRSIPHARLMQKAKATQRQSPLQKPVTAAYRHTQKNIAHFTEPSSHPLHTALTRSGFAATRRVIGSGPAPSAASDPTLAPTASSVFGGATKTMTAPQPIPVPGISAPSLFSQPTTVSSGRASS